MRLIVVFCCVASCCVALCCVPPVNPHPPPIPALRVPIVEPFKFFIGGLPKSCTNNDLYTTFAPFGVVKVCGCPSGVRGIMNGDWGGQPSPETHLASYDLPLSDRPGGQVLESEWMVLIITLLWMLRQGSHRCLFGGVHFHFFEKTHFSPFCFKTKPYPSACPLPEGPSISVSPVNTLSPGVPAWFFQSYL